MIKVGISIEVVDGVIYFDGERDVCLPRILRSILDIKGVEMNVRKPSPRHTWELTFSYKNKPFHELVTAEFLTVKEMQSITIKQCKYVFNKIKRALDSIKKAKIADNGSKIWMDF